MTIYEAGAELFGWYAEHDCYNTKKDYNKLVLVSDTPDEDKAAIACALESFQETGIIKKKESEEGEFWVLNKKFSASSQSVEITSATAQKIHGLVNLYTETDLINGLLKVYNNKSSKFLPILSRVRRNICSRIITYPYERIISHVSHITMGRFTKFFLRLESL